jgi:hypothetical protein
MGNKSYPKVFHWQLVYQKTGYPDEVLRGDTAGSYTRIGANDPYWKYRISQGQNASGNLVVDIDEPYSVNSMTATMSYKTPPLDSKLQVYSTLGTRGPPVGLAYPNNLFEWEEDVRVKASQGFLKRLREQDHKFQGGVFFGEIVPTLKMLRRPFSSLRDGLKNYFRKVRIRGSGHSGKSLRKIIGDTWLEFAFGWTPLLGDIKDASSALISIYANLRRSRINQIAGDELSLPIQANQKYLENLMWFDFKINHEVAYSVKYYGGLTPLPNAHLGLHSLQRLVDMSSFNLAAFVPTVWELIPYSFLIDYFSNVGTVLDAYYTDTSSLSWISMVEKRVSGQTVSFLYDQKKTYEYIVGPPVMGVTRAQCWTSGVGTTYGNRHTQIIRWAHGTLTYSGLRFTLPTDLKKFANMGALLLGIRKMS